MTEQELLYAPLEDQLFFLECIKGLPVINGFSNDGIDSNGQPMPFCLGAHSVRCLREIIEITKPTSILEIGLNVGVSSSLWLNMSDAIVTSVDISDRLETLTAGDILREKYFPRFEFIIADSAKVYPLIKEGFNFDFIFIDGGHLDHHVMADIKLALDLKIKWLAFDDYLPQYGPGVKPSIDKYPQLEKVKTLGNIALYKNTEV